MLALLRRNTHNLVLLGTMVATSVASSSSCQAGPLWNWLFGQRVPVTVQSPVVGGCNTCLSPVQRTTVNYVPQTVYRSSWARVPVTYYRPVTSINQCTGCPTNTSQACTAYQWRVQRVPVTVFRPVFGSNSCCPTTTGYAGTTYAGAAYAPQTVNAGCSSCSTGYASAQPQYLTQPSAVPAAVTVPGQATQPADLQPTLNPGGLQSQTSNFGGTTIPSVPATTAPQNSVLNSATGAVTQASGASFGQPAQSSVARPTIRAPQQPAATPAVPQPATPRTESNLLAPIPNPGSDTRNSQFNLNRVPQLLRQQTQDKTAAAPIRQASTFDTVAWPHRDTTAVRPMRHQDLQPAPRTTPSQPARKAYDDQGWSTAR